MIGQIHGGAVAAFVQWLGAKVDVNVAGRATPPPRRATSDVGRDFSELCVLQNSFDYRIAPTDHQIISSMASKLLSATAPNSQYRWSTIAHDMKLKLLQIRKQVGLLQIVAHDDGTWRSDGTLPTRN